MVFNPKQQIEPYNLKEIFDRFKKKEKEEVAIYL
jgi:hypothetical protein